MKEVYLIRHGESEANVSEFLDLSPDHYIFDAELTAKGRKQAKKTSKRLKNVEFNFVICSPLSRAIQTYEIIFKQMFFLYRICYYFFVLIIFYLSMAN